MDQFAKGLDTLWRSFGGFTKLDTPTKRVLQYDPQEHGPAKPDAHDIVLIAVLARIPKFFFGHRVTGGW
jgi:hypothetical protein